MPPSSINWRLVVALLLLVWFVPWRLQPAALVPLLLCGAGGYLLYRGWLSWTGRESGRQRVTYWRGRRIELGPTPAATPWAHLSGRTGLFVLAGAGLVAAGAVMLLR